MHAPGESAAYRTTQLITCIGNKRRLLPLIEAGLVEARARLGGGPISVLDLFSGSGVVARMARGHASRLVCNDLEPYSEAANRCYQADPRDVDQAALAAEVARVRGAVAAGLAPGFLAELYAPRDDSAIQPGERAFYTRANAVFLDTFCQVLDSVDAALRPFLLAPVLAQASVHANTAGVFKGFYKNAAGVGQFGGSGAHALGRILKPIAVQAPVLSRLSCPAEVYRRDANALVGEIDPVDLAYLDPPYNQHPYGSNYFMLNLLCDYRRPAEISRISGIPRGWNRSAYNRPAAAEAALFDLVRRVPARLVLLSYNAEGFVPHERLLAALLGMGEVSVMDARYTTFRGCRNLAARDRHVTEYLYLIDKR
ncbi:DNA adenine methylase [Novosphingobium sp.]|uniref:DNA adenine methylase n=1 Tax=Novosphingobium sp. TaxID=1874826 RepID=UPI0025E04B67|nr:DNA adenine methylase [Novosphingobium sp.]